MRGGLRAWFCVAVLAASTSAQGRPAGKTEEKAVDSAPPRPRPILSAPLDDRRASDVLLNRVNLTESGRLLVVGRSATTGKFAAAAALGPDPVTGEPRSLPGLLLSDGRSHLVFPVPKRFSLQEGTLEVTWQPLSEPEEFGALFASDTDTAFEAFFAEGRLHFRVAGGQVSAAHRPGPGESHCYRFLWQASAGRRAIFIDGRPAADERGGGWSRVEVGKELIFNVRANLAMPGRGGAPGLYARILIYDRALPPEPPPEPTAPAEPNRSTAPLNRNPEPRPETTEQARP